MTRYTRVRRTFPRSAGRSSARPDDRRSRRKKRPGVLPAESVFRGPPGAPPQPSTRGPLRRMRPGWSERFPDSRNGRLSRRKPPARDSTHRAYASGSGLKPRPAKSWDPAVRLPRAAAWRGDRRRRGRARTLPTRLAARARALRNRAPVRQRRRQAARSMGVSCLPLRSRLRRESIGRRAAWAARGPRYLTPTAGPERFEWRTISAGGQHHCRYRPLRNWSCPDQSR